PTLYVQMDIRNFLKKPKLTYSTETTSVQSEQLNYSTASSITAATLQVTVVTNPVEVEPSSMTVVDVTSFHEFDIGRYIGRATTTSNDLKYKLLTECWTPSESYVFPRCDGRVFRSAWLKLYSP